MEPAPAGGIRINRFLASAGFGSRRACETLVRDGRVRLNGRVCCDLAVQVTPQDRVAVDGRPVRRQEIVALLAYKPRGLVCTAADERGRPTVLSLLPPDLPRLYPVGRLDRESEGLLLLTNDGELALRLTHPRFKVEKEYEVRLDRPFDAVAHSERLLRGFRILGGRARMDRIDVVRPDLLRVVLSQGIKRQIRLMLYEVGYEVKNLRRIRIGPLADERLKPGGWRFLRPQELRDLRRGSGGNPPAEPGRGAPRPGDRNARGARPDGPPRRRRSALP